MKKLIALFLALICLVGLMGCESNSEKAKVLLEQGPWADNGIWIDDESQMYLVCNLIAGDTFATVTAYFFIEDRLYSTQLNLNQGAPIVSFNRSDGEKILSAKAGMDGDLLHLFDFESETEGLAHRFSDMKLTRYSYREKYMELPFATAIEGG